MIALSWIDGLQYVGTPLALVAFVVGVVATLLRHWLAEKRRVIATAEPDERAALAENILRDFRVIETADLTRAQRYELARAALDQRLRRYRTTAITCISVAVILAAVIVALGRQAEAYDLVVRLRTPPASDGTLTEPLAGTVSLEAGGVTATRPVVDNEARFFNLPATVIGTSATVTPRVRGFEERPVVVGQLSSGGAVEIALEPVSIEVCGRVVDAGEPSRGVAGVTVAIDQLTAISGPAGRFCMTVAVPAGTVRRVAAILEDRVVYESYETLAPQNALRLPVAGREEDQP